MYKHLENTIIDKTKEEYKDFPESLDGEIYISGNAQEGWHTKENLTEEQRQQRESEAINKQSREYLSNTDWYVTRKIENGIEIPSEIQKSRQEARERIK